MSGGILVIGSSNVDMIMRLERLPAPGETVTDGEFHLVFGGKGANQAVGAARAGGNVTFLTALGEDAYHQSILDGFRADGIQTNLIRVCKGIPTGTALILVDKQGENCIAVAPGANASLFPADIEACQSQIASSAMIVLQMEIPIETNRRILEIASQHKVPVLFNYAPVRNGEIEVSGQISILVVNEGEATFLSGFEVMDKDSAFHAADSLRRRGPKVVVVTLGAEGVVVVSETDRFHIPALPVTPIDTTAAGDVFCGALAVASVEGQPLLQAIRFANAASAISVTRLGAQPSAPHRNEIENLLHTP